MAGAVSYDLALDGALVPIRNLTVTTIFDGPSIPFADGVTFDGPASIAAAEGSATSGILIDEFIGTTQVGSVEFSGDPFSFDDTFDLAKTPGHYAFTAFASVSGEIDVLNGAFGSGTIGFSAVAGARLGQTTTDDTPIRPFSSVTVTDLPNPYAYGAPVPDVLTITPSSPLNGVIVDPNQASDGGHYVNGAYRLEAVGTDLTRDVEGLVFVPTRHEVAPGKTVTTSFTISDDGDDTELASVVVTATRYPNVPEIVGPAIGHALLNGTGSDDQIIAGGFGNVILTDGGQDYVDAGSGGAVVLGGAGDKMIALGGALNLVRGGDGDDVVSGAPGGLTSATLGNGDDVVTLGGSFDHVVLGNGNDTVSVGGGMSFIAVGSGNDAISVGGNADVVQLGTGSAEVTAMGSRNSFVVPKLFGGDAVIEGFGLTNGDRLDLRPVLSGTSWNGSMSKLGDYVSVQRDGGSTLVSLPATRSQSPLIDLLGSGDQTLGSLLAHHSLIV